jgi:hypothetical protein
VETFVAVEKQHDCCLVDTAFLTRRHSIIFVLFLNSVSLSGMMKPTKHRFSMADELISGVL